MGTAFGSNACTNNAQQNKNICGDLIGRRDGGAEVIATDHVCKCNCKHNNIDNDRQLFFHLCEYFIHCFFLPHFLRFHIAASNLM